MATKTIGFKGDNVTLVIKQGSDFGVHRVIVKNPVAQGGGFRNLTGYLFRAQIRKTALSPVVVMEIPITVTNPLAGEAEFTLTNAQTESIIAGENLEDAESHYVWDMEMVDPFGKVIPVMYGVVKVFRQVTR